MQKMIHDWIEISGYDLDEEVVLYGMDLLSGELVCSICIVALGFWMEKVMDSILFLLISIVGTGTMGGYHCNTRKSCFVLTVSTWLLSSVCIDLLNGRCSLFFIETLNVIFLLFVFKFAPVLHENKPMLPTIVQKNRIRARVYDSLLTALITVLWFVNRRMVYVVFVFKTGVVISMMTAKITSEGG